VDPPNAHRHRRPRKATSSRSSGGSAAVAQRREDYESHRGVRLLTGPVESADVAPQVLDRLENEPNVWMCTLRADGSPHLTPVWFVFIREKWWVCSGERSVKAKNLAADARVSFALEGAMAPVVAEGSARIHYAEFPADVIAAFAAKYGWDITTPFDGGGQRVLFEISVRRWLLAGEAQ
jgi:F420H(2)-dependent biliverdin reductase